MREEELVYQEEDLIQLDTYNTTFYPESYDFTVEKVLTFQVPKDWATREIRQWFDLSLEEFLGWYTFDHSEVIYREAERRGIYLRIIDQS